jgi:hypothetical protein
MKLELQDSNMTLFTVDNMSNVVRCKQCKEHTIIVKV